MSDAEYEVETIIQARVHSKRGKSIKWRYLVKWKGFDEPEDNTWEPSESFQGGSEGILARFWARVDIKGRDIVDGSQFRVGEEVFPIGPPRGKAKRKPVKEQKVPKTLSVLQTHPSASPSGDGGPQTKRRFDSSPAIDDNNASLPVGPNPSLVRKVDMATKEGSENVNDGVLVAEKEDNRLSPPSNVVASRKMDRLSSLPNDILLRIFRIGVRLERKDLYFYRKKPLPIRLSRISRHFRRIILAAPLLWTSVDSRVFGSSHPLSIFLKRSQNLPLDIEINDYDGSLKVLKKFNAAIVHVERWRHLTINAENMKAFRRILSPLASLCAPQLKSVQICCIDDMDERPPRMPIFSGGTPTLQSIHLTNADCFPSTLGTLSSFTLHTFPGHDPSLSVTQFYDYLSGMRSLTNLTLIGEVVRASTFGGTAVDLPSLTSLAIIPAEDYDACMLIRPNCVSYICDSVTTTTLQQLYISDMTKKILRSFMAFLCQGSSAGTPRFPNLLSLRWETQLSESDSLDLMQAFPKLERLTLMNFKSDSIMRALMKQDKNSTTRSYCWPQLSTIDVHWVSLRVLRNVVSTRIDIGKPIRKVRIAKGMLTGTENNCPDVNWLRGHVELEIAFLGEMPDSAGWVLD